MSEPTIILRTKGASIIRTRGMPETALRMAPGNPLILYAEVVTVVPRGSTGVLNSEK